MTEYEFSRKDEIWATVVGASVDLQAKGVNTFNTLPNFRRTKWATNI